MDAHAGQHANRYADGDSNCYADSDSDADTNRYGD